MSIIVMGLSHRTAPMSLLERAALEPTRVGLLADDILSGENVEEVVVVATCNRLEVYAQATTFHGAVDEIGLALARRTGVGREELNEHLYVHYEDRAIAHAFSVACGLDSMALGESQILGQLRDALERAQIGATAGPALNSLFQQALRVGKRAQSETGLDRTGGSLVGEGLQVAQEELGGLEDLRVLVVGAGSMSALAATTVARRGARELVVVNRTASKAEHLASSLQARFRGWDELEDALIDADVILTCTGAVGHVVTAAAAADAAAARGGRGQVYVDLALPRDVQPGTEHIAGVRVATLEALGERLAVQAASVGGLGAAQDLVTSEVAGYLMARKAKAVGPTVAALRTRAAEVVASELARLDTRRPDLDPDTRAEVHRTVHRVVEKLLHTPTVRVKELSLGGQGGDYAQVLRELFDLDPHHVATVSAPPRGGMS